MASYFPSHKALWPHGQHKTILLGDNSFYMVDIQLGLKQAQQNLQKSTSNLKALKEVIKLLWREIPSQLRQQFMNILHDRLVFAGLQNITNEMKLPSRLAN